MHSSLLFVCLGNICRSPMAEAIAQHQARLRGLRVRIDSAGTAAYHSGNAADPRTLAVLRDHGIPYDGRARQVSATDFEGFGTILAMDHENLKNLKRICPASLQHKLHLVLETVEPGAEVGDPYYSGGDAGFEHIYEQLCQAIAPWLESRH